MSLSARVALSFAVRAHRCVTQCRCIDTTRAHTRKTPIGKSPQEPPVSRRAQGRAGGSRAAAALTVRMLLRRPRAPAMRSAVDGRVVRRDFVFGASLHASRSAGRASGEPACARRGERVHVAQVGHDDARCRVSHIATHSVGVGLRAEAGAAVAKRRSYAHAALSVPRWASAHCAGARRAPRGPANSLVSRPSRRSGRRAEVAEGRSMDGESCSLVHRRAATQRCSVATAAGTIASSTGTGARAPSSRAERRGLRLRATSGAKHDRAAPAAGPPAVARDAEGARHEEDASQHRGKQQRRTHGHPRRGCTR